MLRRLISVFAAAALLAACATAPTYTPAATASGAGYSETQIENNRYFVTYRARSSADAALLSDYALLRAADLTLERGKSWFWVDRRALDEQNVARNSGPSVSVGVGGGNYGRRSGVGVGVGFSIPIGGPQAPQATSATVEIRLGDGAKPDDPNAYDARGVSTSLRSRLAAG